MTVMTLEAEIVETQEDKWNITFNILDRVALYVIICFVLYVGLGCFDMLRVASDDVHNLYLRRIHRYHPNYVGINY